MKRIAGAVLAAVLTACVAESVESAAAPNDGGRNSGTQDKPKGDEFEKIAKRAQAECPALAPNPAPQLPDTKLPWNASAGEGFKPGEKITTQAQLDRELRRMRKWCAPFMADLAPVIPTRPRQELTSFDWRLAGPKEEVDSAKALKGEGHWEKVTVPHYGGPAGKAFSFYRTEVEIGNDLLSRDSLFLHFQGVDYYADVFVNDRYVGKHEGLFDAFEFDIKPLVKPGKNIILVRVGNDGCPCGTTQLYGGSNTHHGPKIAACAGPGWNDPYRGWVCSPVGFGLWQRCWLESRGSVYVNDLFVRPLLGREQAEVWVEVGSAEDRALDRLEVAYSLFGQNFKATLAEAKKIDVKPESDEVNLFAYPQPGDVAAKKPVVRQFKFTVDIPAPRIWSPDEPWLYQIQVQLRQGGKVLDVAKRQFGMRSFVQPATSTPKGRFYLNGKEISLRGANMMGNLLQCVIRRDCDQLRDDILLAKIANMNFWRMTQQPCQEEVYDYFDRIGLMAQSDLPFFGCIPAKQGPETIRESGALLRLVRSHPCDVMISYINEPEFRSKRPIPSIPEGKTADVFRTCDTLIPQVAPDQVRKWVDGDYANMSEGYSDHHCYNLWYWRHCLPFSQQYKGAWTRTRGGWMHGCGEYGTEGVDSPGLMRKYYPKEWLGESAPGKWSPAKIPCQTNRPAFKRWVHDLPTLEEWCAEGREHQRCATRLQVEALRRDPKMNSTALHLLIDAWPAGWMKAVMDYDRQAKPAYFEFREAQTPLAVNLRPDRFYGFSGETVKVGAWVCNDTQEVPAGAALRYQVELDGKILRAGSTPAKVTACEPEFQGWLEIPVPEVTARTWMTLRVGLVDRDGKLRHDTAYELEAIPAADKGKTPKRPGGRWQFLIES